MQTNQPRQPLLAEFRAPSWAGDWCPRCEWAQTCSACRAQWNR